MLDADGATVTSGSSGGSGSSITRGVPTAGRIASGGVVERETGFQLASMQEVRLTLRNPDFTTAHNTTTDSSERGTATTTAAAESMTMARRLSKSTSDRFVVHHDTHPQTIAVLKTRAEPVGIEA